MDYIHHTQGLRMNAIPGVMKSNMVYGMSHMCYNNIEKIENPICGVRQDKSKSYVSMFFI